MLSVSAHNTKTENVTITECHFYHWSLGSGNPKVGIEVMNVQHTDVIIKKVWINETLHIVAPHVWLRTFDNSGDVEISFQWKTGLNYTVTIETAAGSTATVTATAD